MNPSRPIWHRIEAVDGQRGESAEAYQAAKLYFELAANRSHEAVSQKLGKSRTLLSRWSSKWKWPDRAAAYDAYVEEQREQALQRARAEDAQRWIERDRSLRERFFTVGELIVEKAERMIREFPERDIIRKEDKEGQVINLTVKTKHSLSGLSQLVSVGAELQRLAVGIQPGSSPLDSLDLTKLSREDLIALLEGRPIKIQE